MSEELKQDSINELWSEMFYAYREWSGRADANLPDDLPQAFAMFLVRRKYQLAQVCEQREKEGIATIQAAGFEINPPETLHGAICQILQVWMSWKDAAEAAELALQKYQERAKELKLQLGLAEEAHHSDVVAKISDLAQARQQAVAEISKFVRVQEPTLGPHTFSKIQDYLRSLTPPPAQSKGANMNTGTIIDELPDAFRRMPGTITEKMTAYREFCNDMIAEIQAAYDAIPDSLNRNLAARIAILKERADRESKLAVVLAQRLHEKGDDFHSHLVFENGAWLTPPPALTKDEPCQEKGVWLNGGKAYCDEHRQGGIPFEFGKKCGESLAMSPPSQKEKP